jgi:hypothetical protein
MPLNLHRRHRPDCPHKGKGRTWTHQCKCPIHVDGSLNGVPIKRLSLKTGIWSRALKIVKDWEERGSTTPLIEAAAPPKGTPILDAVNRFLQFWNKNRGVEKERLYQYERALVETKDTYRPTARRMMSLETYCAKERINYIEQVTLDDLEALQREWSSFEPSSIHQRTILFKTAWGFFIRKGLST